MAAKCVNHNTLPYVIVKTNKLQSEFESHLKHLFLQYIIRQTYIFHMAHRAPIVTITSITFCVIYQMIDSKLINFMYFMVQFFERVIEKIHKVHLGYF